MPTSLPGTLAPRLGTLASWPRCPMRANTRIPPTESEGDEYSTGL